MKIFASIVVLVALALGAWWWQVASTERGEIVIDRGGSSKVLTVLATDPFKGKRDAPVTVIIAASFTCPACREASKVLDQLLALYPDDIKIVWKDVPEDAGASYESSVAARCAQRQGKFWQYHDRLFIKQELLATSPLYSEWAEDIGLDRGLFETCTTERGTRQMIDTGRSAALYAGVSSVPHIQINEDVTYTSFQDLATLQGAVASILQAGRL